MRFTHQPGAQPLTGYTIQRGIHRGGFGEVYYARSDGGKEVALKLLQREQDVELRGVRQCLNLKHPNLVNLFDVRTDEQGEQWVVMEYVNGSSLEDVLASFPNGLPLDEVQDWLSGIVAGVTYLHERGIVHRDLKPANVYRENGMVKVGDVGLSKRLGSDRRAAHTQSVGTVYYMAPEVANGQYGRGVDVYSLGIMLYELLTGRLPFMGETTGEVLMKHLTAHANLDGIPEPFRPVISRALAKDPLQRTQSAAELDQEFQTALAVVFRGSHQSASGKLTASVVMNGAVNGAAVANSQLRMAETPATGAGVGVKADTATSIPVIGLSPARTISSAQAASAYAQNPVPFPPLPKPPVVPVTATASSRRKPVPAATARQHSVPTRSPVNWPLLATIVVGMLLFVPGTWRSWSGVGLMGAACGATWLLRGRNGRRLDTSIVSIDPSVDVQVCTNPADSRQVLGDAAASLSVGSVSACLLSTGALLSSEFFQRSPQALSPEFVTLFATTSLAATWMVLLVGHLRQRSGWLNKNPRKAFLLVGILLGSLAYGLDQYLLVDFPNLSSRNSAAFKTLGVHRLMESGMNPTWLGYTVFFGGIMALHRWWSDMSPKRSRQLSFGRLAVTGMTAWLMTVIFAFPQWPAVLWAVVISAAVQLAAPWQSARTHSSPGRC
jgi:serine/threonine protein kinase